MCCTKTSLFFGVGFFSVFDLLDLRGKWFDDLLEIFLEYDDGLGMN